MLLSYIAFIVDDPAGATANAVKSQAAAIRSRGYDGPLSMASMHPLSQCYVIHLLAFKNMLSRVAAQ